MSYLDTRRFRMNPLSIFLNVCLFFTYRIFEIFENFETNLKF